MTKTALPYDDLKSYLHLGASEAEEEQRALLRGKRILFVMGSYPGKRLMYERAKELGVKMVVLDGPGHWTQAETQQGLFEQFIEVDLQPFDSLADRAWASIKASGLEFDGIATFEDLAGPLTALLAQGLGLPGHPVLAVAFSRNKIYTREVCVDAAIPSPRFARVRSAVDLEEAAAHVGFPAVLKPVSGASSVSVFRVDDLRGLQKRYSQTVDALQGTLKSSQVDSDDELELIWANGFEMTLEEYVDGEEFDVDCLLSEGEMVYAGVVYNMPQPYCKEVGSQLPAPFPATMQAELAAFAHSCLQALEFADGAFHVELKYSSKGPRLIEINARIGGGFNYQMNKLVWGVDLVEHYLVSRLGLPIQVQLPSQALVCLAEVDLTTPYSGVVTRDGFMDAVFTDPRVVLAKVHVTKGQRVVGPEDGVPDWLAEFLVKGETVEAARQTLDELVAKVEIPVVREYLLNS